MPPHPKDPSVQRAIDPTPELRSQRTLPQGTFMPEDPTAPKSVLPTENLSKTGLPITPATPPSFPIVRRALLGLAVGVLVAAAICSALLAYMSVGAQVMKLTTVVLYRLDVELQTARDIGVWFGCLCTLIFSVATTISINAMIQPEKTDDRKS